MSRVGFPALRTALEASHNVMEVPAVAGLTVWDHPPATGVALVETPNRVGRVERVPEGAIVLTHTRRDIHPQVEQLRKRLLQNRGVVAPWDPIEAPWFVLQLPIDPHPVARRLEWSAVLDLPEFPGGVLIDVPRDASDIALRKYAAAFEDALAGTMENE